MTINKQKLIDLLALKTGLEREQIEKQLLQLIKRIQQAAEEGKDFEVEEFGTFRVIDDVLHFEPAEELGTEINHKYAGMKPIELIGSFKHPPEETEEPNEEEKATPEPKEDESRESPEEPEPESEETEKEDPWGLNSLEEELSRARSQVYAGEEDDEKEEKGRDLDDEEESESEAEEKDPFTFDETASDEPEPEPPSKPAPEPIFESEPETKSDPEIVFESDEPEEQKETEPSSSVKTKDPIGKVLVVFACVAVLGVAAWSAYEFNLIPALTGSENQQNVEEETQSTEQNDVESDNDEAEERIETVSEDQVIDEDETEDSGESEEESSAYGLKGEVVPEGNDGYTLVLFSLRNEENAQRQEAVLKEEGFRTIVVEVDMDGEVYWRVSIGQFETIREAQRSAEELDEQYRNNHFIKRIQ